MVEITSSSGGGYGGQIKVDQEGMAVCTQILFDSAENLRQSRANLGTEGDAIAESWLGIGGKTFSDAFCLV